jgi:hypothetical protein
VVVRGASSRDPLNTGYLWTLQAGMLMGKRTADGLWAPSIIGLVTADYTSGATALFVSAATAVEIVRRQGASGTAKITHAPTETGTVVEGATLTYSAVNTSTGELTITNIGANVETGAFIQPNDGSENIRGILAMEEGLPVVDEDFNDANVQCPRVLVAGQVDVAQILNYQAAAKVSYNAWLKAELRANNGMAFRFSDDD